MSLIPHPAFGGAIDAYVPVDLCIGPKFPNFAPGVLLTGTDYKAGSVLGKILAGAPTSAAKSGGNTGDGTFVLDVTTPRLVGCQPGIYTLRVTNVPAAHGSVWELKDPNGISLGNPFVAGTGGTKLVANQIKGVLTDGGTDFIAGDGFDITVAAGSLKLKLCAAAADDGSHLPIGILCEAIDATGGDKQCGYAVDGSFNEDALVFGTAHTADTTRLALQRIGILIRTQRWSG